MYLQAILYSKHRIISRNSIVKTILRIPALPQNPPCEYSRRLAEEPKRFSAAQSKLQPRDSDQRKESRAKKATTQSAVVRDRDRNRAIYPTAQLGDVAEGAAQIPTI